MHSYIYDEGETFSENNQQPEITMAPPTKDNGNTSKYIEPCYLNIFSNVNPLCVKLPPPLQEYQGPLFLEFIAVRVPLSTLTVKDYLPLTPEENAAIEKDLEGDISDLEHKLRAGVVERITNNAFDLLVLRVRNFKNSDVYNENGELVQTPGCTLLPKTISESQISCLEGDFINHKLLYELEVEGADLFSEIKVFRNNGSNYINLSIEYINGGLVELAKNYNITARISTGVY